MFTGDYYTTCQEEVILIFYNLFQKTEAEGIFTKSFYDTSITLILKLDKDMKKGATDQHVL